MEILKSRCLALRDPERTPGSGEGFKFSRYAIDEREVFFVSKLSFAFVNTKPVVAGHVLIAPRRVVTNFSDLTADEVADLALVAQFIGGIVQLHFGTTSGTYAIQDGLDAGRTVEHVHIHVLPRKKGDFEKNDDVYDALECADKRYEISRNDSIMKGPDSDRKPRTIEEMADESKTLRNLIENIVAAEECS